MTPLRDTERSRQYELPFAIVSPAEVLRREVSAETSRERKSEFGQFFTPVAVARFMASMFASTRGSLRLLDPGAGVGGLAAAVLERWRAGELGAGSADVVAHEIDERLVPRIESVMSGFGVKAHVVGGDFLDHASASVRAGARPYTHAILNPPYKKIGTTSSARLACRAAGFETVNLYAAFVGLSLLLLRPRGQLVAIIPRSFCNGPYYRGFRQLVATHAAIRRIHLFESRVEPFADDSVLQENVILHLERDAKQGSVTVSTSRNALFDDVQSRVVPFAEIVRPDDPEHFIHIATTAGKSRLESARRVRTRLSDLGITVSTGPVVDFRLREHLSMNPRSDTVPLLYPAHFSGTETRWPIDGGKKPNAIARNEATERWLYPLGNYAVVRRLSSKEEPRRVVAAVLQPSSFPRTSAIGFENHLNVFHRNKAGLSSRLAWDSSLI